MNKTLLTKKEQLLSSGGMFLVDLLKSLKKKPKTTAKQEPCTKYLFKNYFNSLCIAI